MHGLTSYSWHWLTAGAVRSVLADEPLHMRLVRGCSSKTSLELPDHKSAGDAIVAMQSHA